MVNVRCSTLDQLFACTPAVLQPSALQVDPVNDAAGLGKIVHTLAGDYVANGKYDVKGECARSGWADDQAAAEMMAYVTRAWQDLRKFFPEPQVERPIASDPIEIAGRDGQPGATYVLSGTLDVVSGTKNKAAVFCDWKSGYLDEGYHQQMYGYARCLWEKLGRPAEGTIIGIVVFLRHGYYRICRYDARKLTDWHYDLTHNVLPALAVYRPGGHCNHCRLRAVCPAQKELTRGTVEALMLPSALSMEHPHRVFLAKAAALLAGINAENKGEAEVRTVLNEMMMRLRLAQRAIDDAKQLVRDTVQRVGAVAVGPGVELAMRTVEVKKIDGAKGLGVLRRHLTDGEILDAASISLPKLLAAKAAKYARGEKKAARDQLEDDLESAGALRVAAHYRLEEVDVSEPAVVAEQGEPNGTDDSIASGGDGPGPKRTIAPAGGGERGVDPVRDAAQ